MEIFDLVIIGAGPAGLSASVYASRYGIKHLVLGEVTGGLTTQTFEIGNWLATENITGQAFADASAAHVRSYGVEIRPGKVIAIERQEDASFLIRMIDGKEVTAKTILTATGTHHRYLEVPGEKELAGKGVSYCPTCDGFFFKNKVVTIAGGGDSAAEAGVYLSNICSKVYMVIRGSQMRAEKFWQDLLVKKENIEMIFESNIQEIQGENRIDGLVLDKPYKESSLLQTDGLFVEIGLTPNTAFLTSIGIEMTENGYIKIAQDQSTNIEGIWAAGDATTGSNYFRQIITAASEGAIAANSILQYLQKS